MSATFSPFALLWILGTGDTARSRDGEGTMNQDWISVKEAVALLRAAGITYNVAYFRTKFLEPGTSCCLPLPSLQESASAAVCASTAQLLRP